MKTLLIMRHGKAEHSFGKNDFDRDLTNRGLRQSTEAAETLKEQRLVPEMILSSSALRAQHTAEIVRLELEIPPEKLMEEKDLYLCSVDEMLSEIRRCPPSVRILLVVGHNPTMEYFTDRVSRGDSRIKTSEVRGFRFSGASWDELGLDDLEYTGTVFCH